MDIEVEIDIGTRLVKVPVKVNGQGPFTFNLDTGASTTTITPQLAESLGIPIRQGDLHEARGIGGGIPVKYADAAIGVGSLEFEKDEVYVLDVNALLKTTGGREGVLGYTTLKHCTMSLNYDKKRFKISKGNSDRDIIWTPFKFINDSHLVGVPVHINDKGPFDFVLDTGAGNTVMTPELAAQIGLEPKPVHGIARGIGGDFQLQLTEVDKLAVGDAEISNTSSVVLDLSKVSPKGKLIEHGIIGYDFLSRFETVIDYPKMRFAFIQHAS
ncbi:MAG: retropepsin-like aspartic protease [Candidatus Thorarchaeota archaeon]